MQNYNCLSDNIQTENRKAITLKELYEEYITFKSYEIRESTLYKIKQILINHVLPTFSDIHLTDLDAHSLQQWKIEIEEKNLSFSTRKNIYTNFNALLNHAVKFDYITQNLLAKVGNFKDAYQIQRRINFYTPDQFLKFINEARLYAQQRNDIYEWNYYVFFNIAFFTGLRKGEIHALKWSDITGNILHVTRSINQKLKDGDRETPPKNKSSFRSLQLPVILIKILDEHYKRYSVFKNFTNEWRVCGGMSPLRDTTLDKRNKEFSAAAGIKKIRLHDFRHSHASLLANEGINIQEIARRLGHSNVQITWNTYSHLYPREEERAVTVLDKISEN